MRMHPSGETLVEELRWVHDLIRRDLETVRRLADEVTVGRSPDSVRAALDALATNGPLWQLKVNCLQHCHFVHSHHHVESVLLFPELRRTNPALGPVVDKLEADHAAVSTLLDDVQAAARALGGTDAATRQRLVDALEALAEHLLAHLRYEEDAIADTLRSWPGWPR